MSKNLYDMKLHEMAQVNPNLYATRVPGGWIYDAGATECNPVFVPYHNEFQVVDKDFDPFKKA